MGAVLLCEEDRSGACFGRGGEDEEVLLEEKIREAVKACDLILISGGSSQGKKDMTMEILNRISKEGVFTHGWH